MLVHQRVDDNRYTNNFCGSKIRQNGQALRRGANVSHVPPACWRGALKAAPVEKMSIERWKMRCKPVDFEIPDWFRKS